jgi:hypothetical protein
MRKIVIPLICFLLLAFVSSTSGVIIVRVGVGGGGGDPVAVTGSTYYTTITPTDTNPTDFSIGSITVPSDAEIAIVFIAYDRISSASYIINSDLCWDNGDTDDFTDGHWADGDTYADYGIEMHYMLSSDGNWPGSGSGKTLYGQIVGQSGAPYRPVVVLVTFWKNVNATPIGTTDTDTDQDGTANANQSVTLTGVSASDAGFLAMVYIDDEPEDAKTGGSGQTRLWDNGGGTHTQLLIDYELGETNLTLTDADYPISLGFVLEN